MAPSGFSIKVCLVRVRGALLSSGEALLSKTLKSRLIDLLWSLEVHQCVSLLTEKQPTPASVCC